MRKNEPRFDDKSREIADYLKAVISFKTTAVDPKAKSIFRKRIEKCFSLLPNEILGLFLKGSRKLVVDILADTELPLGMTTKSEGRAKKRKYSVTAYSEHANWPENRFIGAFLRELAHAVIEMPPEDEWPATRGDRARFKEKLEHRSDATVWRWGLRHYSMSYITATYPSHWVERIAEEIGKTMLEDNAKM